MGIIACKAPPRRLPSGDGEYTEFCARPGRVWDASKGGHTEQIERCDHHAAQLRARGYDVRLAETVTDKPKKKWDLTSTNSMEAAAGYLRKNAGAMVVIVIRAADAVCVVDEGIPAGEVNKYLFNHLPEALARLEKSQEDDRAKHVHKQIQSGMNPEEARYA